MNMEIGSGMRVVSGMRPTGRLHLGHYHGALRNWVEMQHHHECFFFVADWHALTTHYEDPGQIPEHTFDMVADWLACGLSSTASVLFVQSRVPEHAELHLLLSMSTPLSWLERVPSYKDVRSQSDRDLSTYGFLGYPLLQAADVLAYKAQLVPVGEDQAAHVELIREVARRFNHLYGREDDFVGRAEALLNRLDPKFAQSFRAGRRRFQEEGKQQALEVVRELLQNQQNISMRDRARLDGYLEGENRMILPEPQELLTPAPRVPGTDGRKMSKSYGNALELRDETDELRRKLRGMMTDPARKRRTDPGDPEKCPVWDLHKLYSDESTCSWAAEGCRSAGIGCTDCKDRLLGALDADLQPIRERAQSYISDRAELSTILHAGCERAREIAHDTLEEVRDSMGLGYG